METATRKGCGLENARNFQGAIWLQAAWLSSLFQVGHGPSSCLSVRTMRERSN